MAMRGKSDTPPRSKRPAKLQDTDRPDVGVRRGTGERLTLYDRYTLLETHKAHPEYSYAELARQCGVSLPTARKTVIAAGRSAVDLMAAYAAPIFMDWRRASRIASHRGDHRPAKEWLLHAGVLDQLPDVGKGNGPAVIIVNTPLPGMPAADIRVLPALTTTPKNE
jgi:hypothetical protein